MSNWTITKWLMALVAFSSSTAVMAIPEQTSAPTEQAKDEVNTDSVKAAIINEILNDSAEYHIFVDGRGVSKSELGKLSTDTIASIKILSEEETIKKGFNDGCRAVMVSLRIFEIVDQMPCFPGGANGLLNYLVDNVNYPSKARKANIEGRVLVKFIVEKNGRVSNVEVERSVHPDLDREAVRVVRAMPRWTPGMTKGEPIRVMYTVPISFRLK